jgi:RecB family exonuclease
VSETTEVIRDTKTGKKAPSKQAARTSQQLTMYGLIRGADVGTIAGSVALDHVYRTPKQHELKYVEQVATRDALDYDALVARLNTATAAVEKGTFVPADESWWGCSEKWCGYWTSCPYTRRSRRPVN